MKFKDYYDTLGIARTADADAIKKAYRKLARKYHPDVSEHSDAEERFKEVQEAYEVLKDAEKREAYDRLGPNWRHGEDFSPPPDWGQRTGYRQGTQGARDFSDFFSSIFGDAPRGASDGGFQMRGQDYSVKVQIALEDSYAGRSRQFTFAVPQVDNRGEVRRQNRSVNVSIPKGITEGQRIRLPGQGAAGFGGGESGDLLLEVEFEAHPLFHAQGRDIYLDLPLAPWEAALGEKVKVPTLGGTVELGIPPGSQAGRRLRLAGRGLPGKTPGDQYVVLKVVLPEARTEEEQALYREMARLMPFDPRAAMRT